ncbi:MAG: glutathione peroxidase, partial [Pseudomonadota bacterium]
MDKTIILAALALAVTLTGGDKAMAETAQMPSKTAYDFTFEAIDGSDLNLASFKGSPLIIVNTASRCGFTKQYKDLQQTWSDYKDQGLVVIGVPSNDFGSQEPGTEKEIAEFCEVNFGVDFPMTEKVAVKGAATHPFYAWARETLGDKNAPRWNFHKYFVDRDGNLV